VIFEKADELNFDFEQNKIQGYRWNRNGEKSSIINFDRYIKPLVNLGYCILRFDAPAHGKSSGKMFNALLYRRLINDINDKYGPVTNFLAHLLG